MLSTTTHQNTATVRLGSGVSPDQQVNHVNNMTISNNHHFNSQAITPKQPPPPSKPPPPPPPPPRSNCYQSQPQATNSIAPSSSSTTSLHSFNNYGSGMTNTNPVNVANTILSNGLTSNCNCTLNSNNDNNNSSIINAKQNKYPNMQPRNKNYLLHGSANLSPGSSISSHSSLSMLPYLRNTGEKSTHCNCHSTNVKSKSNIPSTMGRFVHDELKPGCNHLQDHHHRPHQHKCNINSHSSGTQSAGSNVHVCSSIDSDYLALSCSANNMNISRSGPNALANDIGRCQSMMNCTNSKQQSQIFQASPVSVCCSTSNTQNLIASGNTASIGPIMDNNSFGGSIKNCIDSTNKPIHVNHKHNFSDSSCSTTTNTGNMQHNQHLHNLGCFKADIGCSSDHYGPSSAASTSSANTSSLCSFNTTNDLPPPYPVSKINQPLPPLPSQPPPPPPPPPKGILQQYLHGKSSLSSNINPPNHLLANKPLNSTKQLTASCNTKSNNSQVSKKSEIPPPLPPPNPGTKMAASGLITSNVSDSSYIKSTSPARSCAVWSSTSSNSLNNLLSYDVTQPKPKGPTEAELKLEALTKNYESELEHNSKNGEHLGICNYCGEKVKNAKDACRAMRQIFHVNCFVCCLCRRTLRGKTFYHVQDKVYCEEDYKVSYFSILRRYNEQCVTITGFFLFSTTSYPQFITVLWIPPISGTMCSVQSSYHRHGELCKLTKDLAPQAEALFSNFSFCLMEN